jgi:hypothetical protein
VLDACWMMDSEQAEPLPLATCPDVPDELEWNG